MKKIARRAINLITVITLIVSLTMSMTSCGMPQQINQQSETTTKLGNGNSNTGIFDGERYNELPTINHRTEEEIAQTGLTAQDVLNAYDQLATDIVKCVYSSDFYGYIPSDILEDIKENAAGQFESITPWSFYTSYNLEEAEKIIAPFYALNPNYWPTYDFGTYSDEIPEIPAYEITINLKAYVDGVVFDRDFCSVGVEETQFEQTMSAFGQKPYFLDYDTYYGKVEGICDDSFTIYGKFYEQDAYEPMEITRETIMNATPEQLQTLYNMISSIRSINFEQKLPE